MADPLLAQSAIDRLQFAAYELVLDGNDDLVLRWSVEDVGPKLPGLKASFCDEGGGSIRQSVSV